MNSVLLLVYLVYMYMRGWTAKTGAESRGAGAGSRGREPGEKKAGEKIKFTN